MLKKLLIVATLALSITLIGCDEQNTGDLSIDRNDEYSSNDSIDSSDQNNQDADLQQKAKSNSMMQTEMPKAGEKIAIITTNKGVLKAKLFAEKAPETVKNFEELAKEDKYDGTIFHRIIKDFMIQGGDFENSNGTGGHSYKGPGTSIDDEFDPELRHLKGALSMANSGPNTNGSQFFIVQAESTPWLDGKHSVFGQVYEGLELVDEIAGVETGVRDQPVEDVVIEDIEVTIFQ